MLAAIDRGQAPSMTVNLSLKQLQHSDIVADVRDALAESGLAPQRLTLEITETVLMADTDLAVQRLRELKALGVRLALDDFGTGYSSLSYLQPLPGRHPQDGPLVPDASGATPDAADLATAVVALGATLDLEVVAEGIEFPEQWRQRCASSAATSARASTSPGRWTPTRRSRSSRAHAQAHAVDAA